MKFAVSISGYGPSGDKPITLDCFYDRDGDFLVMMKETPFTEVRPEGSNLVTNLDLQTRDFLFTDEHLRDAIRSYFGRSGRGTIHLEDSVMRFIPDTKIETDGIDEKGPKYRLSADIQNGHVAVLAAVAFASTQSTKSAVIEMMDDLTNLYQVIEI